MIKWSKLEVSAINNIPRRLVAALRTGGLWVATWGATAAYAVNDLKGGPAVNQLYLHPAPKYQ